MTNKLKGIFNNSTPQINNEDNKKASSYKQEFKLVNWYDEGWNKARNLKGSETGLLNCICRVYHNHKEVLRHDEIEQEKAKKPYRVKLQEYLKRNEFLQKKLDKLTNENIPKTKEKVEILRDEIREIKKNPEEVVGEKSERAGFFIGLTILVFLTLYLFVFYSSASYSAFFKEFTLNQLGVADSIFDPQAVSKALRDGVTELILILTIPFVFLGLGYLIHKFQEGKSFKKYLKIVTLILVTFIFDSILAYEITEKIYNLKAENSFEEMPSYTLELAFQSVNFWLIIFAGFVVYLIWGFVFDFVMAAYYKMDKIAVAIQNKYEEILQQKEAVKNHEEEINKLHHIIGVNNTEAEKLKTILNHSDLIKPKELENSIHKFLNGWLEWLSSDRREEDEKKKAHEIVDEFLSVNIQSLNISEKEEQTKE